LVILNHDLPGFVTQEVLKKATTKITCFAAGTNDNSILTLVCFTEYSLYVYVNLDVVNPAIERSQV